MTKNSYFKMGPLLFLISPMIAMRSTIAKNSSFNSPYSFLSSEESSLNIVTNPQSMLAAMDLNQDESDFFTGDPTECINNNAITVFRDSKIIPEEIQFVSHIFYTQDSSVNSEKILNKIELLAAQIAVEKHSPQEILNRIRGKVDDFFHKGEDDGKNSMHIAFVKSYAEYCQKILYEHKDLRLANKVYADMNNNWVGRKIVFDVMKNFLSYKMCVECKNKISCIKNCKSFWREGKEKEDVISYSLYYIMLVNHSSKEKSNAFAKGQDPNLLNIDDTKTSVPTEIIIKKFIESSIDRYISEGTDSISQNNHHQNLDISCYFSQLSQEDMESVIILAAYAEDINYQVCKFLSKKEKELESCSNNTDCIQNDDQFYGRKLEKIYNERIEFILGRMIRTVVYLAIAESIQSKDNIVSINKSLLLTTKIKKQVQNKLKNFYSSLCDCCTLGIINKEEFLKELVDAVNNTQHNNAEKEIIMYKVQEHLFQQNLLDFTELERLQQVLKDKELSYKNETANSMEQYKNNILSKNDHITTIKNKFEQKTIFQKSAILKVENEHADNNFNIRAKMIMAYDAYIIYCQFFSKFEENDALLKLRAMADLQTSIDSSKINFQDFSNNNLVPKYQYWTNKGEHMMVYKEKRVMGSQSVNLDNIFSSSLEFNPENNLQQKFFFDVQEEVNKVLKAQWNKISQSPNSNHHHLLRQKDKTHINAALQLRTNMSSCLKKYKNLYKDIMNKSYYCAQQNGNPKYYIFEILGGSILLKEDTKELRNYVLYSSFGQHLSETLNGILTALIDNNKSSYKPKNITSFKESINYAVQKDDEDLNNLQEAYRLEFEEIIKNAKMGKDNNNVDAAINRIKKYMKNSEIRRENNNLMNEEFGEIETEREENKNEENKNLTKKAPKKIETESVKDFSNRLTKMLKIAFGRKFPENITMFAFNTKTIFGAEEKKNIIIQLSLPAIVNGCKKKTLASAGDIHYHCPMENEGGKISCNSIHNEGEILGISLMDLDNILQEKEKCMKGTKNKKCKDTKNKNALNDSSFFMSNSSNFTFAKKNKILNEDTEAIIPQNKNIKEKNEIKKEFQIIKEESKADNIIQEESSSESSSDEDDSDEEKNNNNESDDSDEEEEKTEL